MHTHLLFSDWILIDLSILVKYSVRSVIIHVSVGADISFGYTTSLEAIVTMLFLLGSKGIPNICLNLPLKNWVSMIYFYRGAVRRGIQSEIRGMSVGAYA